MTTELPCPVCNGAATRVADLTRCNGACGLTLASADFARLSEAAALLKATERLEAAIADYRQEIGAWESGAGFTAAVLPFRVAGPQPLHQARSSESLAAALIALGEDVRP